MIASNKSLVPRVYSFNEINLDFYLYNDNVFHLSKPKLIPAFKIVDESERGIDTPVITKILDELAHRLFTVCAIFMEFPNIQYQGESAIAKVLAMKLQETLRTFYERSRSVRIREPRGTILILDRGFDLISPAIHDYFYESIVYEFKDIGEEGETVINDKTVFLND